MKKERSLATRLQLNVTLVALLTVALFAGLSLFNTQRLFSRYLHQHKRGQQINLAQSLARYYQVNDSFQDLDLSLPSPSKGPGLGSSEYHVVVADACGLVVYDSKDKLVGAQIPQRLQKLSSPIWAQGKQVGTVFLSRPGRGAVLKIEADFRASVWRLTLLAALGSLLVAIVVANALSRRITGPLLSLATATEELAGNQDLNTRLPTAGDAEIATLAHSFNTLLARLKKSQELRQNLLADLAHELRTPVSIIQSQLEAAENNQLSPKAIASLYDEVLRLGRLLEDLKTLAVAEAGELSLNPLSISLRELGEQLETNFQPLAEVNQVELVLNIPDLKVTADPDRLRQILYNLLANSFAHTPAGGKVEINAQEDDDQIKLVISDTGSGIPPEELPFIFSRYRRGPQQQQEGLGLGLAISQALARAAGGELSAENNPTGGARFILTLPRG